MCGELLHDIEIETTILSRYGDEPFKEFRTILTKVFRHHHERLSYYEIDSRQQVHLVYPSFGEKYKHHMAEREQQTEKSLDKLIHTITEHLHEHNEFDERTGAVLGKACEKNRSAIAVSIKQTNDYVRDLLAREAIFNQIRKVREPTFDSRNKELFFNGMKAVVDEQFQRYDRLKKDWERDLRQMHFMQGAFGLMTKAKQAIDAEFDKITANWQMVLDIDTKKKKHEKRVSVDLEKGLQDGDSEVGSDEDFEMKPEDWDYEDEDLEDGSEDGSDDSDSNSEDGDSIRGKKVKDTEDSRLLILEYDKYIKFVDTINKLANDAYIQLRMVRKSYYKIYSIDLQTASTSIYLKSTLLSF